MTKGTAPANMHDIPFEQMVDGAKNALKYILHLQVDERILIVTDRKKGNIGNAFETGAKSLGARVDIYKLPEEKRPLMNVPKDLIDICPGYSTFVNAFESNGKETPFRVELLHIQAGTGGKVGHAPGITTSMMTDGAMNIDYEEVVGNAKRLMNAFKDAVSVHITTSMGTDLVLDIGGREFETDVSILPGKLGNLPAGEIWCAPVEDGANGVLVVDGTIGDIGQIKKPLEITLKNGKIVKLESDDEELVRQIKELTAIDELASVIGELGIGLNPRAKLIGNMLEDEKAGETAHIAFGNNIDMSNGNNSSKTHRDFLFYKPTFMVTYKDGGKRAVIVDGFIVI